MVDICGDTRRHKCVLAAGSSWWVVVASAAEGAALGSALESTQFRVAAANATQQTVVEVSLQHP